MTKSLWRRLRLRRTARGARLARVIMHAGRLISVSVSLGVFTTPVFADLEWETTRVEAKAEPGQERVEAVFAFRNTGDKPVTITSTQTNCGCTTARLAKLTYGPNESGSIRALFEFGDRVGPQQKVVTVTTDASPTATHLVLRVDIPELLALERETLQWALGAPGESQSVAVRTVPGVTLKELDYDPAALHAEIVALEGGGWRIAVKPLSTQAAFRQVIRLHAEFAGKPRTVPLYVSVR